METLGQVLRSARIEKTKTLKEIADAAEISVAFLSQLERGGKTGARKETLEKLARALDIPERDLLLAAGLISDSDKKTLYIRLRRKEFATELAVMKIVLVQTLENMEREGFFSRYNDDYLQYPYDLLEYIQEITGKIPFISSSIYRKTYNQLVKGEVTPETASEIIAAEIESLWSRMEERIGPYDQQDPDKSFIEGLLILEKNKIKDEMKPFTRELEESSMGDRPRPIPTGEDSSLIDVFNFSTPSNYRFNEYRADGLMGFNSFKFPINNLHYHLTDPHNHKLYKDFTLTTDDREDIIRLIDSYLLHKYVDIVDDEDKMDIIEKLTGRPKVVLEWEKDVSNKEEDTDEH